MRRGRRVGPGEGAWRLGCAFPFLVPFILKSHSPGIPRNNEFPSSFLGNPAPAFFFEKRLLLGKVQYPAITMWIERAVTYTTESAR